MTGSTNKKVQQVYLSSDGVILDSCDTLFGTENLRNQSISQSLPILESCLPLLVPVEQGGLDELTLNCVHIDFGRKHGIFDLQFFRVLYGQKEAFFWYIIDKTKQYKRLQKIQQIHHELAIS